MNWNYGMEDGGIHEGENRWKGRQAHDIHVQAAAQCISLKRNMPWLWTYQEHPNLYIPNTNNAIERVFTDIKTKLRRHSGITKDRRIILIQEYIARHY